MCYVHVHPRSSLVHVRAYIVLVHSYTVKYWCWYGDVLPSLIYDLKTWPLAQMLRIIINKIGTDYNRDILESISGGGTAMYCSFSFFLGSLAQNSSSLHVHRTYRYVHISHLSPPSCLSPFVHLCVRRPRVPRCRRERLLWWRVWARPRKLAR